MLEIAQQPMKEIRQHLERSYPQEGCGLLLGLSTRGGGKVTRAQPVRNQASQRPERRYLISSDEIREASRRAKDEGLEILGFFHSHPDIEATPSEFDREHAWPWYCYLIVSVRQGSCRDQRCWKLREDRLGFDTQEVRIVEED